MALPRPGTGAVLGLAGGAALAGIAFGASGGLGLQQTTTVEMVLTLASGLALALAVLLSPARLFSHGASAVVLLGVLAALTAVSLGWSLDPATSWVEASRIFTYVFVFAAAVVGARALPHRWPSVLGAVLVGAVAVCGYALLTKVFPAALDPNQYYARLRAPFGYWNAIGLAAALGAVPCLWLGARRSGHAAVNALAYPALGLMLVTVLLSYSRGALLALGLGCAFWFAAVPLRLRAAAVLATAAAGAAGPVAWAFSKSALTQNQVDLGLRGSAGHQLGILLLAMLIVLTVAGLTIGFRSDRRPLAPPTRHTIGLAILVALALVPVGLGTALALTPRGLGGTISHDWNSLTNPHARTPPNDPSRLTAVGSVRARYWNEALKIFRAHPVLGAGEGSYAIARLRYRQDTLNVQHAHGYVVQTLADLGIVGMSVSLVVLVAWLLAAIRSAAPWGWQPPSWSALRAWPPGRRRAPPSGALDWTSTADLRRVEPGGLPPEAAAAAGPPPSDPGAMAVAGPLPYSPERIGLLTLLACAIVFGVHSTIDWTWFIPGNACVALLCAGWLAGRGPLALAGPAAEAVPVAAAPAPATPSTTAAGGTAPHPAAPSTRLGLGLSRLRARTEALGALTRTRAASSLRVIGATTRDRARREPLRPVIAVLLLAVTLVVAWSEWQPLRSANAGDDALAALERHDYSGARSLALTADSRDPVSVDPLFDLAVIDTATGNLTAARQDLGRAIARQPANPQTWLRLADFDFVQRHDPQQALNDLRPALYLDPSSNQIEGAVLILIRAMQAPRPAAQTTHLVSPKPTSPPRPVSP